MLVRTRRGGLDGYCFSLVKPVDLLKPKADGTEEGKAER
jgi:hypothetical protein